MNRESKPKLKVVTIPVGKKLGEIEKELPHGIINKTYTGIGGTTLELDCNRNSIVVEPLIETAWSKAQIPSRLNQFKIHFFGLKSFKKEEGSKIQTTEISSLDLEANLKKYILDCRTNLQPIKICCVTDQLERLYKILQDNEPALLKDSFLVLDEIDSMQESSAFRSVMQHCIDIYKLHPKDKRILISATIKKFHDPELQNENETVYQYEKVIKENLAVINSWDTKKTLLDLINTLINKHPEDKIVVALNNVVRCRETANTLVEFGILKKEEICILCSNKRADDIGAFAGEFKENRELPARLTFITAAYFVGFDINERYHNIIVAEGNSMSMSLSPSLVYQISGRCRNKEGLFSNHIIIRKDSKVKTTEVYFTPEELMQSVRMEGLIKGFQNDLKSIDTKYSNAFLEHFRYAILNTEEFNKNVLYNESKSNELKVSYFMIDEIIEGQETKLLYRNRKNLLEKLSERFSLIEPEVIEKIDSDSKNMVLSEYLKGALEKVKSFSISKNNDSELKLLVANYIGSTRNRNFVQVFADIVMMANLPQFENVLVLSELEKLLNAEKQLGSKLLELKLFMKFKLLIEYHTELKSVVMGIYTPGTILSMDIISEKNSQLYYAIKGMQAKTKLLKEFRSMIASKQVRKKLHMLLLESKISKSQGKIRYLFTDREKYILSLKSLPGLANTGE